MDFKIYSQHRNIGSERLVIHQSLGNGVVGEHIWLDHRKNMDGADAAQEAPCEVSAIV
jgi:hypothetical protein